MKLALLVLGLCAVALGSLFPTTHTVGDKAWLKKQKDVLILFNYVAQPTYYKEHVDLAKTFTIEDHYDYYTKPEVAKYFYKTYQYGFLPRGEIFSVFYEPHLKQAIALYKLFYYAKDYDTFYKTAVWARTHINEGMYLYALSVAIVHRPDTYGIVLPPIYEIYPYYFFGAEVIQKAYQYKQQYYGQTLKSEHSNYNGYTIAYNYSGHYLNLHPEQSMSYFTEDIGINSFYYYYNIYYPYWLGGEDFDYHSDKRGELFYYYHQQLLARYYLERLSNGFGEIPWFNWEVPFETGYYPSLEYPNGLEFPSRPNYAHLYEYFYNYGQSYHTRYAYSYSFVQDYEKRIKDAIDFGYVWTKSGEKVSLWTEEGFNMLGSMIEGNVDSPNIDYYGYFQVYARHLLGYSFEPLNYYKVAPSALEHYETSLRDPAFYQLFKKMMFWFHKFQHKFPAYTEQDLFFHGVTVKNVEFDRLVTYFDYFYTDISQAVFVTPQEWEGDKFSVRAQQYRLNHKPYTYKVFVDSDKDQESVVHVYLGPKYDEYGRLMNISQNWHNWVQIDHFKYPLKSGHNVIHRSSQDAYPYMMDRMSYKDLWQKVTHALQGSSAFTVNSWEYYFGFPSRYLLPKGTPGGMEYQIYVIVSPYVPYKDQKPATSSYFYPKVGSGMQFVDGYPLGYPFNRPIYYDKFFYHLPNAYFYTAKIYHKSVADINASTAV